jgi:peptidoglycan hydrolase-like protein with peptidoglycan-binding domain
MMKFFQQFQPKSLQGISTSGLPTLRFGSSGNSVRILQRLLLSHGYGVQVDGRFGAVTELAVKSFQSYNNLTPDGIVGPRTWRALSS